MAYESVEKWLAGVPFPERHDFGEEIVEYPPETDGLERFVAYQAIGIKEKGSKECKNKEDYKAAEKIADRYRVLVSGGEADTCKLTNDVFRKLWDEKVLELCKGGDTMNSASTTLNALLQRTVGVKSKRATVRSYCEIPEQVKKACADAQGFLKSVYTVGNFIPIPKGLNHPRGFGPSKDYWDLTLLAVYHYWFPDQRGENPWTLDHVFLRKNEEIYNAWMKAFQSWDDFVEKNYLRDFVRDGRPEQLWEGHFDGDEINFSQFFDRATERIILRGNRMVQELRKKLDNCKTAN